MGEKNHKRMFVSKITLNILIYMKQKCLAYPEKNKLCRAGFISTVQKNLALYYIKQETAKAVIVCILYITGAAYLQKLIFF
jgi:hypothetical protein